MKTFSESLTEHAREYLRSCLEESGGNVRKAARMADVDAATFYRLCQRCNVVIRAAKPRGRSSFTIWLGSKSPQHG